MRPSIRQALPFDREIFTELMKEHSENVSYLPDAALHHYLQSGASLLDVGLSEVCGGLLGCRSYQSRPALSGIVVLAVPRDHWRQGIASALLAEFLDDARHHCSSAVQAWVREDLPANKFFQHHGFRPVAKVQGGMKRQKMMICWWQALEIGATPEGIMAPTAHRRGPRDASPVLECDAGPIALP
jgi:GNAT superfamily N-acetyltransferase